MSTIFVPGAWNKHPDYLKAHYVRNASFHGEDAFVTHCGAILKGEWSEWTFADLGMVPLCEECKAKVHAP